MLENTYQQKSIAELLQEMERSSRYFRYLAQNALVEKGGEGINAAIANLHHQNWKVRSSVCRVISEAAQKGSNNPKESLDMTILEQQVPELIKLLRDSHFWVQKNAIEALSNIGEKAKTAIPELLNLSNHPHPWVRSAAISAISKLKADPQTINQAMIKALEVTENNSSFEVANKVLTYFDTTREIKNGRLAAMVTMLRFPPEGSGGGRLLPLLLQMAVALDPEGEVMIPVLMDAATDRTHLSRQQGGIIEQVIKYLAGYGSKASSAIPVLQKILVNDEKKSIHEITLKAINAISGK